MFYILNLYVSHSYKTLSSLRIGDVHNILHRVDTLIFAVGNVNFFQLEGIIAACLPKKHQCLKLGFRFCLSLHTNEGGKLISS